MPDDGDVLLNVRIELGGDDGAAPGRREGREPEAVGKTEGDRRLEEIAQKVKALEDHQARDDDRQERRIQALIKRIEKQEGQVEPDSELGKELAEMRAQLEGMTKADEAQDRLIDALGEQVQQGVGKIADVLPFVLNPVAALQRHLPAALGLVGGPVGVAATIVATLAATMIPTIIKTFAQKGWPLNRDWRRAVEDEFNAAFDLRQQEERLQGRDSFIVAQETQFQTVSGSDVFNSLYLRDELRQNMYSQDEQAGGIG